MKKILAITAILFLGFTTMAYAGNKTLKHSDGAKVKIKCKNSGCFTRHTAADGTKAKAVRSAGGSPNYKILVKKWNAKGYK